MNIPHTDRLKQLAKQKESENKKLFGRLKIKRPSNLDHLVAGIHDEVFSEINCLNCANCCKTLGPRLIQKDIERLSKFLHLKKDVFTDKFLRMDEDGDYVFRSVPCPFLLADNSCLVYEHRPKACADYPHTNRRKFHQVLDLTLKNTFVCPAAFEIVEKLKLNLK
ncbi:MAG: YkgJ family cysteine cluster protein [Bacteroidales bacterium]|nr:YkgJ family cysteine cluster protein [Bacteroidales bacterium]